MKSLTQDQFNQFFEQGYTVIPNLVPSEELEPLRNEIAQLIDLAAEKLLVEGKITKLYSDEDFDTRLGKLMEEFPESRNELFRAIEGKGGGGHAGREMFNMLTHPKLLDAMEDLVGKNIVASSVYRIRPKVPGLNRGVVPWHQDSGYFAPHCDTALIVTVWMPLIDATVENGCLRCAFGST